MEASTKQGFEKDPGHKHLFFILFPIPILCFTSLLLFFIALLSAQVPYELVTV